jgi:hypothetical protein
MNYVNAWSVFDVNSMYNIFKRRFESEKVITNRLFISFLDSSNVSTEATISNQKKKKSKNSKRKEKFLKALSPKSKKT